MKEVLGKNLKGSSEVTHNNEADERQIAQFIAPRASDCKKGRLCFHLCILIFYLSLYNKNLGSEEYNLLTNCTTNKAAVKIIEEKKCNNSQRETTFVPKTNKETSNPHIQTCILSIEH